MTSPATDLRHDHEADCPCIDCEGRLVLREIRSSLDNLDRGMGELLVLERARAGREERAEAREAAREERTAALERDRVNWVRDLATKTATPIALAAAGAIATAITALVAWVVS